MIKRWIKWQVLSILLISLLASTGAFGQSSSPDPEASAIPEAQKKQAEKESEMAKNLEEARRNLKYGIDSAVLSVINQSISTKDLRLKAEILASLNSINPDIQKAVFDYCSEIQDFSLIDLSITKLENYTDFNLALITSLLKYIQKAKPGQNLERLQKAIIVLQEHPKAEIQALAVETLGIVGSDQQIADLRTWFKKSGVPLSARTAVLKVFGSRKSDENLKLLKEIAGDQGEDKVLRMEALSSIGKTGDLDSLGIIQKALLSTDLFERGSAIAALEGFPIDKVKNLYEQALRDAHWRNRQTVLKLVADKKISELIDAVMFMAELDPEKPVKIAAVKTLSSFEAKNVWDFLEKLLLNDKTLAELRIQIVDQLITKHSHEYLKTLQTIFDKEFSQENSQLFVQICKSFALLKDSISFTFYEKMLDAKNINAKYLAFQGLKLNGLGPLKPKLETMLKKESSASIKASIEDLLK